MQQNKEFEKAILNLGFIKNPRNTNSFFYKGDKSTQLYKVVPTENWKLHMYGENEQGVMGDLYFGKLPDIKFIKQLLKNTGLK